jgi:hypothetical protein
LVSLRTQHGRIRISDRIAVVQARVLRDGHGALQQVPVVSNQHFINQSWQLVPWTRLWLLHICGHLLQDWPALFPEVVPGSWRPAAAFAFDGCADVITVTRIVEHQLLLLQARQLLLGCGISAGM